MEKKLRAENEILRRKVKELQALIKTPNKSTKKSKSRKLDFAQYKMRKIALKFCYLGWSYCGLAQQATVENTVTEKIIDALELCKLIEDRETNIVVCGRTDKGVSAFQQVISLNVRSALVSGRGIIDNTGENIHERKNIPNEEIDYVFILNKVLPKDIRILAWSPVDEDFSARFNSVGRSYKYFFPKSDLSIESMKEAGKKLIGSHDFRNFCSMQISQGIKQFVRKIFDVTIEPFDELEKESEHKIYVINISASSFIYHQIRCTVAILLMIGQGKEDIDIIDHLLDVEGVGGLGKPFYQMASDLPLVFYEASYDDMDWQTSKEAVNDYVEDIQNLWVSYQTKQTILKLFLDEINLKHSSDIDKVSLVNAISTDVKADKWKPLLKRPKELTLKEKLNNHSNKKLKDFKE